MKRFYGCISVMAMLLLLIQGCDKDEDSKPQNLPEVKLKSLKIESSYVAVNDTIALDDTLDVSFLLSNPEVSLKNAEVTIEPASWTNILVPVNSEKWLTEESDLANGKLVFEPGVKSVFLFISYAAEKAAMDAKKIRIEVSLTDSLGQKDSWLLEFECEFGKELSSWTPKQKIKAQAAGAITAAENFSFLNVLEFESHSLNEMEEESDTAHVAFIKLDQANNYGEGFALITPSHELLENIYALNGLEYRNQKNNPDGTFSAYYGNKKPTYFQRVTLSENQNWETLTDMDVRSITKDMDKDSPQIVDKLQDGDVIAYMLSDYTTGLLLVKGLMDKGEPYESSMEFELKTLHK